MNTNNSKKQTALKRALAIALAITLCFDTIGRATAITYDSATSTYFDSVDDYGLSTGSDSIGLQFGGTLGQFLRYNRTIGRFVFSDDLDVQGTISGYSLRIMGSASISGTLALEGSATISGSLIVKDDISTKGNLTINSDNDANDAVLTFGNTTPQTLTYSNANSRFEFSSNIHTTGTITAGNGRIELGALGILGQIGNSVGGDIRIASDFTNGVYIKQGGNVGIGTTSPDTTLEVIGTISGTTLNANTLLTGSTLQGFGLYNCQGTSNKLTYNSTTKKFLCESDQAGSSYTAGQGLSLNGSSFSVNATLTGSLAEFSTLSGNVVHAKSQLSSSGNLVIETTANSEFIRLNDSTNASSIGFRTGAGDPNGIVSATLGSLFIASDTAKIWKNNNGSTQWVEITTGSGSTHIAKMVDTNGTTISATPTLIDFDTEEIDVGDIANSSTDRFTVSKAGSYLVTASYQVDQNYNTQMHAMIYKNGTLWKDTSLPNISTIMGIEVTDVLSLQIGDYIQFYGQCESYDCISSTSSTDKYARMSIVQLDGISGSGNSPWTGGSVAYLTDTAGKVAIGASNADTKLEVIGTISGTTLNANTLLTGSTLQGFGLYNCQGTSNKLTYNSTTKKFLCESDQAGSSYTAGQGLSLNGSSFSVNATLTGSLAKFSTLSGYVVHAKNALSSSGTLRVVGAGTFDGSLTFGDALADAITVNAGTWTFANDTNFVLSGGVNGLSFDTSTLSIDATNDRVGIGTTAPKTTLDVVGTVSGSAVWGYNLVNSQSATSGSVLVSRQNNVPEWKSPISSLVWFLDGVAVQAASQGATVTMPYGMSLSSVTLRAKNAPTGSALIVDINENGTTLFSTRPQINASATTGGGSAVFSDTTLAAGSDITVDIDQIGSTVAGSGVTIMLNGVRRY